MRLRHLSPKLRAVPISLILLALLAAAAAAAVAWTVAAEHPKRGLVLKTYQSPADETLRWLVEACRRLCPLEIVLPWQAVVRTR